MIFNIKMTGKIAKILALDYGSKRIGVAVSDPLGITAQPVAVINRKGKKKDIPELLGIIKEREVGKIVVGLPFNMNGSKGTHYDDVKRFGALLEKASGLPVDYIDERLTTMQAEKVLLSGDVSRNKRRKVIDKMAAVLILQNYLDSPPAGRQITAKP
ncbi:MAG: Holliday junction resolvase RuvX [Nitrospinota bacterium]